MQFDRILFMLIACAVSVASYAIEIDPSIVRSSKSAVWYCHLLDDGQYDMSCSLSATTTLPWEFVRGPNGHPLLDSLDELLLTADTGEEASSTRRWVPLFAAPYDAGGMETLARAVLCRRAPECSIKIVGPRWF